MGLTDNLYVLCALFLAERIGTGLVFGIQEALDQLGRWQVPWSSPSFFSKRAQPTLRRTRRATRCFLQASFL